MIQGCNLWIRMFWEDRRRKGSRSIRGYRTDRTANEKWENGRQVGGAALERRESVSHFYVGMNIPILPRSLETTSSSFGGQSAACVCFQPDYLHDVFHSFIFSDGRKMTFWQADNEAWGALRQTQSALFSAKIKGRVSLPYISHHYTMTGARVRQLRLYAQPLNREVVVFTESIRTQRRKQETEEFTQVILDCHAAIHHCLIFKHYQSRKYRA